MGIERRGIELSLAAGKRRKSAQTGFVHLCYASNPHGAGAHDTIPLYENFCYALALLRSRLSEQVLEAKAFLERLLAFEVQGNFPVYLHEYPQCKDRSLSAHLLPVFHWILVDFSSVLGEALSLQIAQVIERVVQRQQAMDLERPLPAAARCKLQAFVSPHADLLFSPRDAKEWGELWVALQMALSWGRVLQGELSLLLSHWHPQLLTFLGPHAQDEGEPQVTLGDLCLGHYFQQYPARVERDHPVHLQAVLAATCTYTPSETPPLHESSRHESSWTHFTTRDPAQPYLLLWGDHTLLHSFVSAPGKSVGEVVLQEKGAELIFTLPDTVPPEGDERMEIAFFCNRHPDQCLTVNGRRATTFHLQDEVTLLSRGRTVRLRFALVAGQGAFFGHIALANRPTQKGSATLFDAYDWQIGLRTIERTQELRLKVSIEIL